LTVDKPEGGPIEKSWPIKATAKGDWTLPAACGTANKVASSRNCIKRVDTGYWKKEKRDGQPQGTSEQVELEGGTNRWNQGSWEQNVGSQ
jgi:hypothetical protein